MRWINFCGLVCKYHTHTHANTVAESSIFYSFALVWRAHIYYPQFNSLARLGSLASFNFHFQFPSFFATTTPPPSPALPCTHTQIHTFHLLPPSHTYASIAWNPKWFYIPSTCIIHEMQYHTWIACVQFSYTLLKRFITIDRVVFFCFVYFGFPGFLFNLPHFVLAGLIIVCIWAPSISTSKENALEQCLSCSLSRIVYFAHLSHYHWPLWAIYLLLYTYIITMYRLELRRPCSIAHCIGVETVRPWCSVSLKV